MRRLNLFCKLILENSQTRCSCGRLRGFHASSTLRQQSLPKDFEKLFDEKMRNEKHVETLNLSESLNEVKKDIRLAPIAYGASSNLPDNIFIETSDAANVFSCISKHLLHKYFVVNSDDLKNVYGDKSFLPKIIKSEIEAFQTFSIMVRKPCLELIHYLEKSNYDAVPTKALMYGKIGSGKTMCLLLAMHYAVARKFLVIPCLDMEKFTQYQGVIFEADDIETSPESAKAQQPVISAEWLADLIRINVTKNYLANMTTSKDYNWGLNEVSEKGSTLLSLVQYGIDRPRRSSKVISAVLSEIKTYAKSGNVRVAFVIDGIERLFKQTDVIDPRRKGDQKKDTPIYKRIPHKFLHATELESLVAFRTLLDKDWKNGVVLGVVQSDPNYNMPYTPRAVLGIDAYNYLSPFIPTHVPLYNNEEFLNQLSFYRNRKWLQEENIATVEQLQQLLLLTDRNPKRLQEICSRL